MRALAFVWRRWWLRYPLMLGGLGFGLYLAVWLMIAQRAYARLAQEPVASDVVLVLGNRAYLHGAPNPCLAGRVGRGVDLMNAGLGAQLMMTGGVDVEDGRIESAEMALAAARFGWRGAVLQESRSTSSVENLRWSGALLKNQSPAVRSVTVVSDPYHLWRVQKLVEAGHLGSWLADSNVRYAAAHSDCWDTYGMFFKGALREPLAIVDNWVAGAFSPVD
jgi:uncharacterized SAM-binding protein YcdF (DUF218 family)